MMEDYDIFCKNQFTRLKGEGIHCGSLPSSDETVSVVQFHGVAVLSPLITVQRREKMQKYREKAIELDMKRQNGSKKTLLNRVQEILESVQVKKLSSVNLLSSTESETKEHTTDSKTMNGYTILPNVLNLPKLSTQNGSSKTEKVLDNVPLNAKREFDSNSAKEVNLHLPLRQTKSLVTACAKETCSEISQIHSSLDSDDPPPAKEAPDPYVMSLQNLLKKSREYIEREQSRRNLKNIVNTGTNESHSDKENDTIKISDSLKEKARLLHRSRSCSPLMVDKPTLNKSNTLLQAASTQSQSMSSSAMTSFSKPDILRSGTPSGLDSESDEELKHSCTIDSECSIVKSLTGSYAKLPSPEPSLSPKMHRRRPRTSSAGHIVIKNPINAYDLSPKEKGKTMDLMLPKPTEKICLSDPVPVLDGHTTVCSIKDNLITINASDVNAPQHSPKGSLTSPDHRDVNATNVNVATDDNTCSIPGNVLQPGCILSHLVDIPGAISQNVNKPNVEIVKRNSPVELNKSYDVETPSPMLVQSNITTQATDSPDASGIREQLAENSLQVQVKRRLELDLDNTQQEIPLSTTEQERWAYEPRTRSASLHTNRNDASLHTNRNDASLHTNRNDASLHTNRNDASLHTNRNDASLHTNRNDASLHTNRNDASLHSNRNDASLHSNRNDASLHSNRNDASLHSNRNDASLHSNRNDASLHSNRNDASPNGNLGDHLKKKMLVFEEMRRKLEEQHAHQLSLLIAEQQKEQERLQKEFEEEEKRVRFKDEDILEGSRMKSDWRSKSGSLSDLAPSKVEAYHSPSPHSSGGSVGSTSQHSCASTNDSSFALWGPTPTGVTKTSALRSAGRARTRWSQVYSPQMQRKCNKVTALAKGFLTRRIMQTEKLRNLKQTVKDTAEFMRTFQKEIPLNRGAVSAQDVSLHERVHAQLRAALYEIHDIFFAMDAGERMNILSHDRELRREKLIRQMEKLKSPRDRVNLSSATQKSLDRRKVTRAVDIGMANKKLQIKPKTPETRVLQPSQGQNASIHKLLSRQGICKKNPKKEAKCCDNLRRQHSLG
ncbi:centriolar coiled-coil protein of 110 kDa isoform 2-T2 [Discoglossus pictus]